MAVANLVLQYIRTLVWPCVALLAVVSFRGEVRGLFHRLTSLAGAGFDLKFEADARTTLQAAQLTVEQPTSEEANEPGEDGAPTGSTTHDGSAFDAVDDVVDRAPDAAIMAAWRLIEIKINELGRVSGLTGAPLSSAGGFFFPSRALADQLPLGVVGTINDLRKLRGRVAHGEGVTVNAARDYIATARLILHVLDSRINNLKDSTDDESPPSTDTNNDAHPAGD